LALTALTLRIVKTLVRTVAVCLLLLVIPMLVSTGFADESEPRELDRLKKQLIQLEQRFDEVERQHAAEIEKLKKRIEELSREKPKGARPEDEIDALRRRAETEAAKAPVEQEAEEVTFKAGAISLQALNPEISVTGDMVGTYDHRDSEMDNWHFDFRTLGIHLESYLDPYTRFKAAVPVTEDEAKIGEAYFTRFGILDGVNLTAGKFRQQFGVVNRWHKHGLDQVDFPLALRQMFGGGGLNQTGVSVDWTMPPLGTASQELTFQLTNGENDRLFGDNSWSTPSLLLHYKNFRDLTKDTYLEFGTTGLLGWNDEWQVCEGGDVWAKEHDRLPTWVFGGDLTVRWEPTERMRYRNVEWRSELYLLDREVTDPFEAETDTVTAWGAYSYLQTKLSRTWDVGIRLDYYEPDYKSYAGEPEISLAPLAWPEHGAYRWQVGPYITWYQSPFVRLRLEYDHEDGHGMDEAVDRIMLQMIFAAGPHKHERY